MMTTKQFCLIASALGNENRTRIVQYLAGGEMCACQLLAHFQISQPTLSNHMKILRQAGLVSARQDGKWQHYSLNGTALRAFAAQADTLAPHSAPKQQISAAAKSASLRGNV